MKGNKLVVRRPEREALHAVLDEILSMENAEAIALVYCLFAGLRPCQQCKASKKKGQPERLP